MFMESQKQGSLFGGTLLVAGTCIGAGMLAIPIATQTAGLFPAMAVNVLCWAVMLCTGLLFLEATLWMPDGANVLSIANRFLGPIGKFVGGATFLLLYYCLVVAYIAGGTPAFFGLVHRVLGITLEGWPGYLLFTALFGGLVAVSTRVVDRVNWLLMAGLIISYFLLVGAGSSEVDLALYARKNWAMALPALPIFFVSYGYHNIIPTISTHLGRRKKALVWAIIIGTLLPLVFYSSWQWVILGTLDAKQLAIASERGTEITDTLRTLTGNHWMATFSLYFSFFALVTSLLGVALSMVDFLGDGFGVKKRSGFNRIALAALVFIPPLLFAKDNPGIFKETLGLAGGFGEALLNSFFPIGMVWVGRYRLGITEDRILPGGKPLLVLLFTFTLLATVLETLHLFGR